MRTVLIEASPWNASTGAVVATALAGGGVKAYTHRSRNDWLAGVVAEPKFSARVEFTETGFSGGSRPEFGVVEFAPGNPANLVALQALLWNGAAIEVLVGDDEDAAPTWSTRIKGMVEAHTIRGGTLSLKIRDASADLDTPVAADRFAGTGGLEGDAFVAERTKRRAFGWCANVEALSLKASTNIYELADPAFPLTSIDDVKDIGRSASSLTVVAWAGSAAATLAALEASSAPTGGGCVAPSIACVKWWTQPVGPLTADICGPLGSGSSATVARLAELVVASRSTLTFANAATAAGWRTGPAGLFVDSSSESVAQALDRLLLGASLAWNATAAGIIELSEIKLSSPIETLTAIETTRSRQFRPLLRRRIGFQRNHRQHSEAEIASSLRDDAGAVLTAGASWTTNVSNRPTNLAALSGSEGVNNAAVSIASNGALAGGGGGSVTFSGLGGGAVGLLAAIDLATAYITGTLPTGKAATGLVNANITIASNGSLSGGGGGSVTITGLGYTGELNADLTLILTGSKTVSVPFDYGGGAKSGALPVDINFKLANLSGGDLTTSASWAGVLKSGTATFTPTVGSPNATGTLNVSAMSTDAVIEMQATYGGKTVKGTATLLKNPDPPPVGGGGSGGSGTSASTSTISSTSSSSYGSANTSVLSAQAGAGGVVNLAFGDAFYRSANGVGNCYGKWQWRVVGGTFADVATEIMSDASSYRAGAPEPENSPGSLSVTMQKTGLTNGTTYEFQLLLRSAGSYTIAHYGTASATGA